MPPTFDLAQASAAVADPTTPGATLQAIAADYPSLWRGIASHPQAYPGLLDWLSQVGDDSVKAAVAARRVAPVLAVPQPVLAPQPVPAPPARRKTPLIIALIGLVVVAVVAAIVVVPRLGGGSNGGLKVTGTAPASAPRQPTFLDGMRQLPFPTPDTYYSPIGATETAAVFSYFGTTEKTVGVDLATGETLWTIDGACSGIIADQALACEISTLPDGSWNIVEWVDVRTGQTTGILVTSIGGYIFDVVATSQGVLVIGSNVDIMGNYPPDQTSAAIGYYTGPGAPKWTTSVQMYAPVDEGPVAQPFDEAQGLFAWHINSNTYVLDAQTGFVVYQANSYTSAQIFSNRRVCVGSDDTGTRLDNQQINVPNGSPAILTTCDGDDEWMMRLGPDHPDMLIMTSDYGTSAQDPAAGYSGQLWSSPELPSADAWPAIQGIAWDGQSTAYAASGDGRVWAFNINTGDVLWQSTYQTDGSGDYWYPMVSMSDGLVAVDVYSQGMLAFPALTVLRADNGQPIPSLSADGGLLMDGVLSEWHFTNQITTTVYVPAFSDQVQANMQWPQDMPSCPSGMSVVSWTKYDTGSVLVCGGDQFQVTINDTDHPRAKASKVDFGAGGITITCTDGTVYRIGGGASIVVVDAKGNSSVHPAAESWMASTGQVAYPSPAAGIQACPAGTWPISLSTWDGGWLLVCGTDQATPTWLGFSDGTTSGTTSQVTAVGPSYCGTIDAGQVCAYAAPAIVTLTDSAGNQQQYPVSSNYFPSTGAGGTGQGTGAYGVPAPGQSAADQARYLEQVLQASAQTRADLRSVLSDLNNKIATDYDIATLQGVAAARQQQISAIDAAPVTLLPDGASLAAQLRQALSVSAQTDELYVQWAQQIRAQDWAGADATVAQWRGPAQQSEVLKQGFCDQWNTQIAPAYGVSTFTAGQI
ncbi:MAG: hypothetical protein FWF36_05650 [Propionibacteriaceae bacterium]|nr:hypothetical protein [Propionibacteriaceae bacterium]